MNSTEKKEGEKLEKKNIKMADPLLFPGVEFFLLFVSCVFAFFPPFFPLVFSLFLSPLPFP